MNRLSLRISPWTLVLLLAILSPTSRGQDTQKVETPCRNFVQSFYDWYVQQPEYPRALKDRPSAFSPELYRALREDRGAQAKADDIVGLDWDPILSGNDRPPGEHYVVDQIGLKRDGTCLAELHQVWSGGKGAEVVAAELVNHDGRWRFVNFYYVFPKSDLATSVSQGGLLTILKDLREARQKAAKAPSVGEPTAKPQGNVQPSKTGEPPRLPTPRQ